MSRGSSISTKDHRTHLNNRPRNLYNGFDTSRLPIQPDLQAYRHEKLAFKSQRPQIKAQIDIKKRLGKFRNNKTSFSEMIAEGIQSRNIINNAN